MSKPKFSIIVVYYNAGNKPGFLDLVVWGLSRQTFKDFELIFIDNNSPIPLLLRNQDKVAAKVYRMEYNYGQCTARNTGAELACGDRIIFNDGDFVYSKNFLETHAKSKSDIFITLFSGMDLERRLIVPKNKVKEKVILYEEHKIKVCSVLMQHPQTNHFLNTIPCGASFDRKVFLETKYDLEFDYGFSKPGKGWEDVEIGIRLYKDERSFDGSTEAFTVHIAHPPFFAGKVLSVTEEHRKGKINWEKVEKKHPDFRQLTGSWYDKTRELLYSF